MQPYQRRHQLTIIRECARKQSFTDIADRLHVSITTVLRHFDCISYSKPVALPAILSLDEFRENAQGQTYQIALVDPARKTVLDILPQRNTQQLLYYFTTYPYAMRKTVNYIVMDSSPLFRLVVQCMFPNAAIICDKYHIVRQVLGVMKKRTETDSAPMRSSPPLFQA
ncbi:MAG: transposase [Candidatus Nanoperiomorbaceae bacterium]